MSKNNYTIDKEKEVGESESAHTPRKAMLNMMISQYIVIEVSKTVNRICHFFTLHSERQRNSSSRPSSRQNGRLNSFFMQD